MEHARRPDMIRWKQHGLARKVEHARDVAWEPDLGPLEAITWFRYRGKLHASDDETCELLGHRFHRFRSPMGISRDVLGTGSGIAASAPAASNAITPARSSSATNDAYDAFWTGGAPGLRQASTSGWWWA